MTTWTGWLLLAIGLVVLARLLQRAVRARRARQAVRDERAWQAAFAAHGGRVVRFDQVDWALQAAGQRRQRSRDALRRRVARTLAHGSAAPAVPRVASLAAHRARQAGGER